jgi:hypothetical protein
MRLVCPSAASGGLVKGIRNLYIYLCGSIGVVFWSEETNTRVVGRRLIGVNASTPDRLISLKFLNLSRPVFAKPDRFCGHFNPWSQVGHPSDYDPWTTIPWALSPCANHQATRYCLPYGVDIRDSDCTIAKRET